jgi:sarcosine oxidase subunit beta
MPLTLDVGSGFWTRKIGAHALLGLSRKDEPSSLNTAVDWEWLPMVRAAACARIPALKDAQIAIERCWAGLYEVTPDANPVLGRHPQLPSYVDVSGFSGHGIMHAPAAGMLIAEEIIDGRAHSLPIDDLRITRFAHAARSERNVF